MSFLALVGALSAPAAPLPLVPVASFKSYVVLCYSPLATPCDGPSQAFAESAVIHHTYIISSPGGCVQVSVQKQTWEAGVQAG